MALPVIAFRFSNPTYQDGKYTVSVDATSDTPNKEAFGANLRFFYDSKRLKKASATNVTLKNFQGGYGKFTGNSGFYSNPNVSLGALWFGLDGAASYVNTAFQLYDKTKPKVLLNPGIWSKLFEIEFLTDGIPSGTFAPAVIWDLERDHTRGGYIAGSDGLVITVLAEPGTGYETAMTTEDVVHLNWVYNTGNVAPFGYPTTQHAITV